MGVLFAAAACSWRRCRRSRYSPVSRWSKRGQRPRLPVADRRVHRRLGPHRRGRPARGRPRVRGLGADAGPGHRTGEAAEETEEEIETGRDHTPPMMILVPCLLLPGHGRVGLIPGLVPAFEQAAARFANHGAYATWVLRGRPVHWLAVAASHVSGRRHRLRPGLRPRRDRRGRAGAVRPPASQRAARPPGHPGATAPCAACAPCIRGHIGDYIAWWTAGRGIARRSVTGPPDMNRRAIGRGLPCRLAVAAAVGIAGCGPLPPQAPLAIAKKLDSSTSDISTACGEAYQVAAFPGHPSRSAGGARHPGSIQRAHAGPDRRPPPGLDLPRADDRRDRPQQRCLRVGHLPRSALLTVKTENRSAVRE